MPAGYAERYASQPPARTLLELIRGAQYNDPTAITERLTPQWGATPQRLAAAMPQITGLTRALGTPHVLAVERRGDRAVIDVRWGNQRGDFVLVARQGGWRLARVLVAARRLRIAGITSP
jgi:hypothetical protein